jgi:hypothetical protein
MTIADDSWCFCGHSKACHQTTTGECSVEDCDCQKFRRGNFK